MEKLNLYQKLLVIQKKINGLGKDKKSFSYSYVTGDKVLGEIKPLMNELGLILKQEVLSIDNLRMDYQTKTSAKTEILSKVMMQFTWIDTESGEKDVNLFGANGQNDFEKGLGSALTYAERYFLLKFFHISTDEDDIDNDSRKQVDKPTTPIQPTIDIEGAKAKLIVVKTLNELKQVYESLPKLEMANAEVIALKDKLKATLK
jgi:hypothetical protein